MMMRSAQHLELQGVLSGVAITNYVTLTVTVLIFPRTDEESKTKQRHDVTTPSSHCVFFH